MSETLSIVNLGSGSKGNATIVFSSHGGILIDNGFSRKELLFRMDAAGIPRNLITAVILTHEHSDHFRGVRLACDTFRAPLYITADTYRWAQNNGADLPDPADIRLFAAGSKIEHEGMVICPFKIQHDAIDPVGLVISYFGAKIGIATDLGEVNQLAATRLADCDYLLLESNYDLNMLRNSPRPFQLKRRIMGNHGHLDNCAARAALPRLLTSRTRWLTLGHLSSECNCPKLVNDLFVQALEEIERRDILLEIAAQSFHSSLISIPADALL